MSRLGKRLIPLPQGILARIDASKCQVEIKGPKGSLSWQYPAGLVLDQKSEGGSSSLQFKVDAGREPSELSALWGLARSRVNWMVEGVEKGFSRQLEIQGVGYRARVEGNKVVMTLGASHLIEYAVPTGVTVTVDQKQTAVTISGLDKALVGLVASQLRAFKPPEPYKGKGVRYQGEQVTRKAGKTAATGAGKGAK